MNAGLDASRVNGGYSRRPGGQIPYCFCISERSTLPTFEETDRQNSLYVNQLHDMSSKQLIGSSELNNIPRFSGLRSPAINYILPRLMFLLPPVDSHAHDGEK